MNHLKKTVTGAVLLCLFSSNAFALGDGININGLKINPMIGVTEKHNDNITRAEKNTVSSWVTVVNPAIDITAGSDINNLTLGYALGRGDYHSSRNDSYTDHFATAVAHNELTSKAVVDVTASYNKSHDARGTTFSGIATGFNTPDRWREAAATAQFSYGGKDATGRIELNGGFSAKRYVNHRSLTIGRDLNTTNTGAIFYYRIAPRTSALFEGDYDNFDYRLVNSLLDSHLLTLYVGLTWEATAKTTGVVKVGWQRKKFKRSNRSGRGFFSLDAQVEWSPLTYSIWTLQSAIKATESDSNGSSGSYIKTNNVQLDWAHAWSDRLKHTASVGYQHDRYVGTVRRDNTIIASVGVDYELAPWLVIGAVYDYTKRDSNTVNASYRGNIYSLTITGTL